MWGRGKSVEREEGVWCLPCLVWASLEWVRLPSREINCKAHTYYFKWKWSKHLKKRVKLQTLVSNDFHNWSGNFPAPLDATRRAWWLWSMSEEAFSQSEPRQGESWPMRSQHWTRAPLYRREGEELSGCLKLSSPLAHPRQGFRSLSWTTIWEKPGHRVTRQRPQASLFETDPGCPDHMSHGLMRAMWGRPLARQTLTDRGDANKGRTRQYAEASQPSQLAPVWLPGLSSLSFSLSPSLLLFTVLISRVLVCLCI